MRSPTDIVRGVTRVREEYVVLEHDARVVFKVLASSSIRYSGLPIACNRIEHTHSLGLRLRVVYMPQRRPQRRPQ